MNSPSKEPKKTFLFLFLPLLRIFPLELYFPRSSLRGKFKHAVPLCKEKDLGGRGLTAWYGIWSGLQHPSAPHQGEFWFWGVFFATHNPTWQCLMSGWMDTCTHE